MDCFFNLFVVILFYKCVTNDLFLAMSFGKGKVLLQFDFDVQFYKTNNSSYFCNFDWYIKTHKNIDKDYQLMPLAEENSPSQPIIFLVTKRGSEPFSLCAPATLPVSNIIETILHYEMTLLNTSNAMERCYNGSLTVCIGSVLYVELWPRVNH